jgi:hypothetical protein
VDLIALVTACSLTVDPKLMHALVWHQSGGEPWSFSVRGERQPYVWRSAQQAVAEAHRSAPRGLSIRIGLTGLRVDSDAATLALFMPCSNVSTAGRQVTELVERCKIAAPLAADPARCAIAAYGGSWDHPDDKFADAVLTSAAKGDAPDFDMPGMIDGPLDAAASQLPGSGQRESAERPAAAADHLQAWSSGLFPAKAKQVGGTSASTPDANPLQESSVVSGRPMMAPSHGDGLFVRRSPERRPQ